MRIYIIIFISVIFLMIILVTYMGMNSTIEALEFHDDEMIQEPLDRVSELIKELYVQEPSEEIADVLIKVSEYLDDAGSRLTRRKILSEAIYYRLIVNLIIVCIICIAGIVLLWLGIHRFFISPLNRTFRIMSGARELDWSVKVPKSGFREIRDLQEALNCMLIEIRESQEQIKNMERDNIGRFMAHQIKNSLTPIRLCSYNIQALNPDSGIVRNNSLIIKETEKIQKLIDQFRILSRFPELNSHRIELNSLIRNMIHACENVNFVETENPVYTDLDPFLFEQALVNIIQNGLEASIETSIPVQIRIENSEFPSIVISDSGCGIPGEMLSSITEEEYTTKQKGMGIGLAFVLKVVEAHGFTLKIQSRINQGTTVRVDMYG